MYMHMSLIKPIGTIPLKLFWKKSRLLWSNTNDVSLGSRKLFKLLYLVYGLHTSNTSLCTIILRSKATEEV